MSRVGRQDILYKWIMDNLPKDVEIRVKGIRCRWDGEKFISLRDSSIAIAYGNYALKDVQVNGINVREFHNQNGTCQELPEDLFPKFPGEVATCQSNVSNNSMS